jgi:hypothetical protein
MGHKKLAKAILVSIIGTVVVLGVRYVFLHPLGRADPDACISEEMMTIPDLAGAKIEIVYTNCDTLVKDEAVKVYFSRAAVKGESWFARWRNHRTLVFCYDPGGRAFAHMPLPSITHPSPSTILISIPEVSSILFKTRKWENMSIDYAIGKVY